MTSRLLRCLIAAACTAGLAAYDAAPAVVTRDGKGAFDNAFVLAESVDGIEFTIGDPASPSRLQLKRGAYSVDYKDEVDANWLSGLNRRKEGNLADAYARLAKAASGSAYQWVREAAAVEAAACALALKRPDDAIAQAAALEKAFPRSLLLPRALWLRAQAELDKGDAAAVQATIANLKARAKDWGPAAEQLAARTDAARLRAQKKHAEAATAVQALWTKGGPDDGPAWAELGLELAADLVAAGRQADTVPVWSRLALNSAEPAAQAKARLGWAQALAGKDPAGAFDQAAIAILTRGADDDTAAAALALASSLVDGFQKDPAMPPADKLAYRTYLSNLR